MRRAWIAIALLSASWLWGIYYYQEPSLWVWGVSIGAAVLLLGGIPPPRLPSRIESAACLALALPVVLIAPGVYRAIPLLIIIGMTIQALPRVVAWLKRLGAGALVAGVILLAQALAMYAYEALTARSHDLPRPFAAKLAALARLIGVDAGSSNNNVNLFTMRRIHPVGATWELLLDPVTVCFFVGGLMLILLTPPTRPLRATASLLFVVLAWLPLRVALMLGIYLHRALMTDYDAPMDLMSQFFS